ncbi:hypothetical protein [Aestuariibaculum suncheonense]|uniref:DUF4595 domain-containing protein n=1 Tax=Aestuariibaculum suncheonense TaxID=1028745 RepID=A0A8J6QCQ6_9FLAO|nr:hypothetical protein [Aestuariibaculum suncheonense]MBD0834417.1 hypothetical protein [Aestuariibaculum suncheonense]
MNSCSNDSVDNSIENIIPTYLKKVTISQGPDYNHRPNSTRSFTLNYNSTQSLTSINIQNRLNMSGEEVINNATFQIEYENNQIVRAYCDCEINDCYWDEEIQGDFDGILQLSFEYSSENGLKKIVAYEQTLNSTGEMTYSNEIERYLVDSNNFVKQVEGTTEILYSNNNIIGVKNSSSFNDGLKYLDYDNKTGVTIFTDDTHIMDINDYFTRLILGLKYSKNNFKKLDFPWRNQRQTIDFEYDNKNRPIKRTVFNKDVYNYTESFEYLE